MSLYTQFARNKYITVGLIVVLVGGSWYAYSKSKTKAPTVRYVTAPVVRGTITVAVSGTGQIAATNQLDLKPQSSGTVTKVLVKEGQTVTQGQTIATIDQRSAISSVNQARVSLQQAQASYDKLVAGPTDSEIASSDLSVQASQQSLDTAKRNLENTKVQQAQAVAKAYTTLLNADLEITPSDTFSSTSLTLSGSYTGTEPGTYTIRLYPNSYATSGLGSESQNITRGIAQPLGRGLYVTFGNTGTLNPDSRWTIEVPNTKSASYASNQLAYTTAQQTQTQSIASSQAQVESAETNLAQAKLAAKDKLAAPEAADVLSAQAQVQAAQIKLSDAQDALKNTTVTAPFAGTVAKLSAVVGDSASTGTSLAILITPQQIAQISLNEVDAAKIKVGQKATLTFSALDSVELTGMVIQVDAIGTVTQNVVNYTAKIALDAQDERIKPGMSVSANIITNAKSDVLLVSNSAVKSGNNGSYVETLVSGQPVQHAVEVGLVNDSQTEVAGDVKVGDAVVTQTINSSTATTTTSTQRQGNILQLGGGGGAGGGAFRGAAGR